MTPWSVRPIAGWSNAAARSASLSILHAPSSSEYSEWTCRCAQVLLTGQSRLGARSDGTQVPRTTFPLRAAFAPFVQGEIRPLALILDFGEVPRRAQSQW